MNPSNQRLLRIKPDLLLEMFKVGKRQYEVLENAVPDDARIVAVGLCEDEPRGAPRDIYILIGSESFPAVAWKEGDAIPELVPSVRR